MYSSIYLDSTVLLERQWDTYVFCIICSIRPFSFICMGYTAVTHLIDENRILVMFQFARCTFFATCFFLSLFFIWFFIFLLITSFNDSIIYLLCLFLFFLFFLSYPHPFSNYHSFYFVRSFSFSSSVTMLFFSFFFF